MILDSSEYGDRLDADICGYCFADKITEVRKRNLSQLTLLCEAGRFREIAYIADVEIRIDHAKAISDSKALAIYEKFLRLLMS